MTLWLIPRPKVRSTRRDGPQSSFIRWKFTKTRLSAKFPSVDRYFFLGWGGGGGSERSHGKNLECQRVNLRDRWFAFYNTFVFFWQAGRYLTLQDQHIWWVWSILNTIWLWCQAEPNAISEFNVKWIMPRLVNETRHFLILMKIFLKRVWSGLTEPFPTVASFYPVPKGRARIFNTSDTASNIPPSGFVISAPSFVASDHHRTSDTDTSAEAAE